MIIDSIKYTVPRTRLSLGSFFSLDGTDLT